MNIYIKFAIFGVAYLAVFIGIYAVCRLMSRKRANTINKNKNKNREKNRLYVFYRLFKEIPILKKTFSKVLKNTELVYPSDQMSINNEATKVMLKAVMTTVVIITVTSLLANGDLWYIAMGVMSAFVIFHNSINAAFVSKENVLIEQLKDFLSCVRHHYMSRMIVEDAVEDTLDEIPYEIGLHISKIHEILVSPLMDEKVNEYQSTSPNKFLMLLLSICTSSKEYANGEQGFLDSLSYLKEEVNAELLRKRIIKAAFYGLTGICLCVVFAFKPVEVWAVWAMPTMKDYYQGQAGKITMILIFIITFIDYYLIDALKDTSRSELVINNIWSRIAELPKISTFLNRIVNKNYTKMREVNEDMKEIGDHTGPKAYLVKRFAFAGIAFIITILFFSYSTLTTKLTFFNDYAASYSESIVPNEKYLEVMEESRKNSVKQHKKDNKKNISKEDIKQEILAEGTITNGFYAESVADEVIKELNAYHDTYFKWWMMALAFLAAVLAYHIPGLYLKFRCKLASMNKEEEINQFQTLILILMNADGIRIDTILEWMERFSYSFKPTIEECILNLENGEMKALETMKNSEQNKNFRRFCDCLMEMDETDIRTAFAEIEIDRSYSIKEREQQTKEDIENRSGTAKMLAFMPTMLLLFGYLIVPIVIMAVKMVLAMDLSI